LSFCYKLLYNIKMFRSWSTLSRRYSGVRERAAVWSSRPRIIPPNTATDPLSRTHARSSTSNHLSFHPGSYICAPNVFPEHTQDHQQATTFRCPTPNVFFVFTCFNLTCVSFFQIAVFIKAAKEILFKKWKEVKRRREWRTRRPGIFSMSTRQTPTLCSRPILGNVYSSLLIL